MEYETLKKSLGSTIKSQRHKYDYSQEKFAEVAGIHRTYVGDIERGERNVSLYGLVRIANALDMPLSQLISEAEELAARRG